MLALRGVRMGVRGGDEASRRILDLDGHDAYRLLDVDPDATEGQVVAAYRRAMTRAHPDTGGSAAAAKLVNCAFDVLTRHRGDYDRYLADLDAEMISGLGCDPRAARAEAGPGDLRITRVGPNGVLWFSWPGVEVGEPDGPAGPAESTAAFGGRPRSGQPGEHADPAHGQAGPTGDHTTRPERGSTPPPDDGSDESVFRADAVGDGSRSDDGAHFAAFAAAADRSRARPPSRRRSGRMLPLAGALGLGVVAVVAVVGVRGMGPSPDQVSSATASPWTTSRLSVSALPAVPPPAPSPSPTTPGATVAARPTMVSTGWSGAAGADAGPTHSCRIDLNGALWCTGSNGHGELGDGTTTDRAASVRVGPPALGWSAVVIGPAGTCALQTNAGLWCWGDNTFGELGDGSFAPKARPAQVQPGTRWLAVALDTHACGVQTDHTLWCWGANTRGELDDGITTSRPVPQRVGGETSWAAVTVGSGITCGIRQNGSRTCWGQG